MTLARKLDSIGRATGVGAIAGFFGGAACYSKLTQHQAGGNSDYNTQLLIVPMLTTAGAFIGLGFGVSKIFVEAFLGMLAPAQNEVRVRP